MKHRFRTFNTSGIVLKRKKLGETDRLVTILTQEHGKLLSVAKGVRKLDSSKRAFLEPGNYVQAHLVVTKSLPLLIQAKLLEDCAAIRISLVEIRKLTQFLEVLEKLFVEEELEDNLFEQILSLRRGIAQQTLNNGQIKAGLGQIIQKLGYRHPNETDYDSILDYVSELADRPMHSFEYLATKK